VTRAVRKLYHDHGALVSGEWRIIGSDPQAIEIESPVQGTDWTRIGVIRCRLDRRDGSLERGSVERPQSRSTYGCGRTGTLPGGERSGEGRGGRLCRRRLLLSLLSRVYRRCNRPRIADVSGTVPASVPV
jgi:hypothetical protein